MLESLVCVELGFWYELCGPACENRLEFWWFFPSEQLSP